MKTRMLVALLVVALPLAGMAQDRWLMASLMPSDQPRPNDKLEQENQNDRVMWQFTRQVLDELGFQNQTGELDSLWGVLRTPRQWADLKQTGWPEINEYDLRPMAIVALCRANEGESFANIFQLACRTQPNLADLFTGLALWTQQGGSPRLQNREHLALHFIYGGGTEATIGLGYAAAIGKEMSDQAGGGSFNLDEMAAAIAGAEWVHLARTDPNWVKEWATGQKNFARNLPQFHRGDGEYSRELVEKIHAEIVAAYAR